MSYKNWFNKHADKHKKIVDKLLASDYTKEQIIEYFTYENMVEKEKEFCPLYAKEKKCHDIKNLNCYLCACPNFRFNDDGIKMIDDKKQYSFCDINSKYGEQAVYGDKIHQNCTKCTIPHIQTYVNKYFDYDFKVIMQKCWYKC